MTRTAAVLLAGCAGLAGPAAALSLDFPANAALQAEVTTPLGGHAVATGPWTEDGVPGRTVEGRITRQAWRIDGGGLTALQMTAPLRDQLADAGFATVFECEGEGCGGFDFRATLDLMSPPDMYVDLVDFRYLAAVDAETGSAVTLIASRTARAGFVQVTAVGPPDGPAFSAGTGEARLGSGSAPAGAANGPVLISEGSVAAQLETIGRAILPDLVFETGSAQLGAGAFPSLRGLADYLAANPGRVVALVGHTDSVGGLDGNIALSRRRAASVLERLVSDYGVPRRQLQAEGMGYLAPIASNLSAEGREANRRVEVIMVSTE